MKKNPNTIKDFAAMKDVALYWMEKSYRLQFQNQALEWTLQENNIEIDDIDIANKIEMARNIFLKGKDKKKVYYRDSI